jgi:hypothetical protein
VDSLSTWLHELEDHGGGLLLHLGSNKVRKKLEGIKSDNLCLQGLHEVLYCCRSARDIDIKKSCASVFQNCASILHAT